MICSLSNGLHVVSNSSIIPFKPDAFRSSRVSESNRPSLDEADTLSGSLPDDPYHFSPPDKNIPLPPRFPFPRPLPKPFVPDGWKGSIRSGRSVLFASIGSGSQHNYAPGEERIMVDYSRLVSFFDPALTSLVAARMNRTRGHYRIAGISPDDINDIMSQLDDIFTRDGRGSGIDWGRIANVVVKRYPDRLKLTRHLLKPSESRNITERAALVRAQVLTMLSPYMLTSAIPPNTTDIHNRSWIAPIVSQCAFTLTSWASLENLTRQEKVIKHAIEEVQHEICRVLGDVWLDAFGVEDASVDETRTLLVKWSKDINGLMDWLGWSVWDECVPGCGPEVRLLKSQLGHFNSFLLPSNCATFPPGHFYGTGKVKESNTTKLLDAFLF
jgi:hypothetical protein